MVYLAVPIGSLHGWGVCGKYLTRELSSLCDVSLITDPFDVKAAGDELDFAALEPLTCRDPRLLDSSRPAILGVPLLECITGATLDAYRPHLRGAPTVGYTFFEDNLVVARHAANARRFDAVAAGSLWCAEQLEACGAPSVHTIIQGIDTTVFNSSENRKEYFRDRFVVFSGGKFELRKGQDLVIRAFKALADRHPDALLVASWCNFWPFSLQTMAASPYIRFNPSSLDYPEMAYQVLRDNGIGRDRAILLLPRQNALMARIYKNTDVGLFPNRCEGGTNLVLMEYMACGKPAVASWNSGHKDILTEHNSVRIERMRPITLRNGTEAVATWDDPDLEETVERLEWAYNHRDDLRRIGRQAAEDMQALTWRRSAEQFLDLLAGGAAAGSPERETVPAALENGVQC